MARNKRNRQFDKKPMLFNSWNYKVLALGLLLVVIGFTAMYLENEVHGIISLFVSPILIMAGYLTVILAIMKRNEPADPAPDHISN